MTQPLRFLTAGESHGPKLTAILEGVPAGFFVDVSAINKDLHRRQQGFGRGGRMKIEEDQVHICAGVVEGHTTGAPIALEIVNLDYKNWRDKEIEPMTRPRPGHADYAGAIKYGHSDLRLTLERASARETAIRTAVGSLCKQLLEPFGIKVVSYVIRIGPITAFVPLTCAPEVYEQRYQASLNNEFAFAEPQQTKAIEEEIFATMKAKDTLGGIFEVVALHVPPGLGTFAHWDQRLDAHIAQAMMSIPAMKGVEIGAGFENAEKRGTEVHDEFELLPDGVIKRLSNRAGGLEGGMSNGNPIVVRVAMKPISTTLTPRKSIDLAQKVPSTTIYERSDFCAIQRAVPIGEAMLAFVLANALCKKLGGDSLSEMKTHFASLKKGVVDDFSMKKEPWRFHYAHES